MGHCAAIINLPLFVMQISEQLQSEQMFAIAVPKDECYQGAPREQEQASKEIEPCMVLVLHHSYAEPEGATRFGIHMVQILRTQ
jgi:hypothetical protein